MKRMLLLLTAVLISVFPVMSVCASDKPSRDEIVDSILNDTCDYGQFYCNGSFPGSLPLEDCPVFKSGSVFQKQYRYYTTVTDSDGTYINCLGTGDTDKTQSALFSLEPGFTGGYMFFYTDDSGEPALLDEFHYNPDTGAIMIDRGQYTEFVIHDGYSLTYLTVRGGNVHRCTTQYYVTSDGTSSYYQYLKDLNGENPEPDSPSPPSEPVGILDMANVALLFSVSILTTISENPFLAFILAGPLVIVCIHVLRQVKSASSS